MVIHNLEIQNPKIQGREYDLLIWNSTNIDSLRNLGNPIPVEIKATKRIESKLIDSLIGKASSQGFKSIVLVSTAELSKSNLNIIRNSKAHSNVSIIVIDLNQLRRVNNSKDLIDELKRSLMNFYIY